MQYLIAAPIIRSISPESTIGIRHEVLWPSRSREQCILDEDATGLHFGAFVDERMVSVISLFHTPKGLRARKFATLRQWQGRGIGTALMQQAIALARETKQDRIWCDARVSALSFYVRQGFKVEGEFFCKNGLQYAVMAQQLLP